jgi:hypothetical protein
VNNNFPHLLHLVWFRERATRLKVEDLGNIRPGEDVVTASCAQGEAQAKQESLEISETNIAVRRSMKNSNEDRPVHITIMRDPKS